MFLAPRVLFVLVLGFASGLPLALTGATLTFWLAETGISKGSIGLFTLVGIAYGWKFVWAPAVDRLPIPLLTGWLGRRRGWLVLIQLALAGAIAALGLSRPAEALALTAGLAVLVAFLSASQDIVVDAWRIELLDERRQGAGAAMLVAGYRTAMLASGAGALLLAEAFGWSGAYGVMAILILAILVVLLVAAPHEPQAPLAEAPAQAGRTLAVLRANVVAPFVEFFGRIGWRTAILVLLFITFYKLGDAILGAMANPFYVELGFTKTEVAGIVKVYGLAATLIGGFVGGALCNARGIMPALWICGIAQLLSNLVFVAQAWVGHDVAMLTLTITLENLAGGMGTAAFVAYLSSLCNLAFTATQYALLSSFMAQARTVLSASSGFLAEDLGWIGFFLATAVAALPGLLLLVWLQRRTELNRLDRAGLAVAS